MRSSLDDLAEFLVHKCLKSECPGIVCLRWNKIDKLGTIRGGKLIHKKIADILGRVKNMDDWHILIVFLVLQNCGYYLSF